MSIAEIETAIKQLPADQVSELMAWLAGYHEQVWDKQIADDLESGRLDSLLAEVDAEIEAGLAKPL
jgi:hypothetical protein